MNKNEFSIWEYQTILLNTHTHTHTAAGIKTKITFYENTYKIANWRSTFFTERVYKKTHTIQLNFYLIEFNLRELSLFKVDLKRDICQSFVSHTFQTTNKYKIFAQKKGALKWNLRALCYYDRNKSVLCMRSSLENFNETVSRSEQVLCKLCTVCAHYTFIYIYENGSVFYYSSWLIAHSSQFQWNNVIKWRMIRWHCTETKRRLLKLFNFA